MRAKIIADQDNIDIVITCDNDFERDIIEKVYNNKFTCYDNDFVCDEKMAHELTNHRIVLNLSAKK